MQDKYDIKKTDSKIPNSSIFNIIAHIQTNLLLSDRSLKCTHLGCNRLTTTSGN